VRATEQDRPDVARERRHWRVWQRFMDSASFVFLDETGTSTNMARRYGRCPQDERLVDAIPHGHVWTPPRVQEESPNRMLRVIGCCHVSGLCCG
jgi:hypothetical protein